MFCPSCGTANPEGAQFCRQCGSPLAAGGRPQPAPRARPVPPTPPPTSWWYPLGALLVFVVGFLFIDLASGARLVFFATGIVAVAFLIGGFVLLQALARPGPHRERALAIGAVFLVGALLASVLVLRPLYTGLGGKALYEYEAPFNASTREVRLTVDNSVGGVSLRTVETRAFLAKAWVNATGWGGPPPQSDIGWSVTNGTQAVVSLTLPSSNWFGFPNYEVDIQVPTGVVLNVSLTSSLGGVAATFGAGAHVGDAALASSTGGVSLAVDGADLEADAQLSARTSTGGVDVRISLPDGPAATIPVTATTSTGGVTADLTLGPTVAARGSATTSTGGVTLGSDFQGTPAAFQTANLATARTILLLTLTTSTGGITVR